MSGKIFSVLIKFADQTQETRAGVLFMTFQREVKFVVIAFVFMNVKFFSELQMDTAFGQRKSKPPNLFTCQTKLKLLWHCITTIVFKSDATGFVCPQ